MKSAMIIAAEASSALFAQRILEKWKKSNPEIQCFGVGSAAMEALGFRRLGHSEDMAVVGASEIIEHYGRLKGIFNQLVAEAEKIRPQVVVLMDYPEFNLMLAKKLHALGLNVVYYITPQVWAWRQGRVKKIKKYCKKVLVIFPFEVPFFENKQVPVEFVGHPLLDEVDSTLFDPQQVQQMRRRCGIQDDELVLGLMPGSRRSELKNHFQIQLEVARRIYTKYSKVKVLVMVAPTIDRDFIRDQIQDFRIPHIVLKDEPFRMIAMTDVILASSGTATLMVALMHKPMVIMYKMSWLSGFLAKILVRGIKYIGLASLILDRKVVPEFFQEKATPEALAGSVEKFLMDPAYYQAVKKDLANVDSKLGEKGATDRVVKSLNEYFVDGGPR